MKVSEAARHFGSEYRVAKILGINQSCITRWSKGIVPMKRAWQLHVKSEKKLPFNPDDYNSK